MSTICAEPFDDGNTVFPPASGGCQRETEKRLVKSVESFDQRVESKQVAEGRSRLVYAGHYPGDSRISDYPGDHARWSDPLIPLR
jgi:hypothetical protein